ncbi:hypothetical protein BVX97_02595 [bacterium E08(2017)]|nr:hypothetical protein BVX97_02595 [bacterium E08(2017)]
MPPAESRKWTSSTGDTVNATFQRESAGKVYLKTDAGKSIRIPLNNLSAADKEYVKGRKPIRTLTTLSSRNKSSGGTLSSQQLKDLKENHTFGKKNDETYLVSCSAGTQKLNTAAKKKYAKSGKVPVRLTYALYKLTTVKGKKSYNRVNNGNCHFYLQDSTGNVVLEKKASLSIMCPS